MTTPCRFIRPTPVTDARLTSSTAVETAPAAYAGGTTYALDATVSVAGSAGLITVYQSLQAANTGQTPASSPTWWKSIGTTHQLYAGGTTYAALDRVLDATNHIVYESLAAGNVGQALTNTAKWLKVGASNKFAMFDGKVGTATTAPESITVVLAPGRINSLALLQIDAATVTVALVVSSVTVYSASMDLSAGTLVGDWYQYFYESVYQQDALVITDLVDAALLDLPAYSEGVLTVTLSRPGGTVSCGVLVVGLYADLGLTEYNPTIGITDYSRKEADAFGTFDIVQRAYSKRMNASIVVSAAVVDQVARVLAQYRSTLLVWVGAGSLYTSMIIYGFYKDWDMTIENYSFSRLSLQVEGLV